MNLCFTAAKYIIEQVKLYYIEGKYNFKLSVILEVCMEVNVSSVSCSLTSMDI